MCGLISIQHHANLFGNGGELHNVERLIIGGRTLVNVDDHRRFSSAAEKGLEELGEFAFSERNTAIFCSNREKKKAQ